MTKEEIEVLERKIKLKRQLIQWTLNDIEDMETLIELDRNLKGEKNERIENHGIPRQVQD